MAAGICGHCYAGRPVETVSKINVGDDEYRIPLCDPCADALQSQLLSWARCGTIVDRQRFSRRADSDERGEVTASYIHVPAHIPVPATPATPPKRVAWSAPQEEPWDISVHARERMEERGVSEEDVLKAANHPTISRPGKHHSLVLRTRDLVQVVVNVQQRKILTVINLSERERELADVFSHN
jgi:hypothetical protein